MNSKNALFMFSGLILCLCLALFFFGADTDISKFLFSAVLAGISCLILMRAQHSPPPVTASFAASDLWRREYAGLAMLALFMAIDWRSGRLAAALGHYLVLASAGGVYLATRHLVGRHFVGRSQNATSLWQVLSLSLSAYALWAFIDFLAAPGYLYGTPRPYHEDRLAGAFLSANIAASLFGTGLVVALSLLMRRVLQRQYESAADLVNAAFRRGWPGLLGILFCASALMLTASRAGIAIFGFVAVLYTLWEWWASATAHRGGRHGDDAGRRRMSPAMIGVICGIGVLGGAIVLMSGGEVGLRYADLSEGSNGRGEMFSAYWHMALKAPLLGHGPGSFAMVNQQAMTADNAHILVAQGAAHNVVLQWLIQSGFPGAVAMTAVTVFLLGDVLVNIGRGGRYKSFSRAILCISFGLILHSMVDFPLELPSIVWLWAVLLGFGAGLSQTARAKTSSR